MVAVAKATAAQDVQLALYAEAQRRGYAEGDHRFPRLLAGPDAAVEVAALAVRRRAQRMTGSVGLRPTLAALDAGAPSRWPTRSR